MRRLGLVAVLLYQSCSSQCEVIDAFIDAVTGSLKKGENVTLVGFGTFSQGKRAARSGRNPQTGAPIKIPAAKTAKFAAGAKLKAAVNGRR